MSTSPTFKQKWFPFTGVFKQILTDIPVDPGKQWDSHDHARVLRVEGRGCREEGEPEANILFSVK